MRLGKTGDISGTGAGELRTDPKRYDRIRKIDQKQEGRNLDQKQEETDKSETGNGEFTLETGIE